VPTPPLTTEPDDTILHTLAPLGPAPSALTQVFPDTLDKTVYNVPVSQAETMSNDISDD